MKISSFLLIFGFAFTGFDASIARAGPGCWTVIQGKAINEAAAKLLPKDCQEFRKSYLKELKTLSQDPKKFSKELSGQILAKKSYEPPYDAILISMFPERISEELKSAIHARAKIENSKNVKFKYAVAAEERLQKGICSPAFHDVAFDEICKGKDLVYTRIEALQTASGARR